MGIWPFFIKWDTWGGTLDTRAIIIRLGWSNYQRYCKYSILFSSVSDLIHGLLIFFCNIFFKSKLKSEYHCFIFLCRIGECSKTHLYIDLRVLDFSCMSKPKLLKNKKFEGGTKKIKILKIGWRA